MPFVESGVVGGPQAFCLVEEEVVGVAHGEEVGQEGQGEVLSEEAMGVQHAEFVEEGQHVVLLGQLVNREAGSLAGYMLRVLKMPAFFMFFDFFYW